MAKGPKVTRNSTTPRPPHPQMDRLAWNTRKTQAEYSMLLSLHWNQTANIQVSLKITAVSRNASLEMSDGTFWSSITDKQVCQLKWHHPYFTLEHWLTRLTFVYRYCLYLLLPLTIYTACRNSCAFVWIQTLCVINENKLRILII